ncbi:MAG: DUF6605 domain-containing protein, partial [Actinomycetota bacterium]|nr:DUF6605 domain-containing protein [Actinomycetota bacterium]
PPAPATNGAMSEETLAVVGYCDTWSVRAGGRVAVMTSCTDGGPVTADLVRLVCGDDSRHGRGFEEHEIAVDGLPVTFDGHPRSLSPGSHARIPVPPLAGRLGSVSIDVVVRPTTPDAGVPQAVVARWDAAAGNGFALGLDDSGRPTLWVGDGRRTATLSTDDPLVGGDWCRLSAAYDGTNGELRLAATPLPVATGGFDPVAPVRSARTLAEPALLGASDADLLLAAVSDGDGATTWHLDGRIESPRLAVETADGRIVEAAWDLAQGIGTTDVIDTGPHGLAGTTVQSPARAVTGSRWDGTVHRWSDAPEHYAAIHFHRDDLTDARWDVDVELTIPETARSGIYAVRLRTGAGAEDRVPLFVRPAPGAEQADVAFLVPTATYLAYANHRMAIDGTSFFPARSRLRPAQRWLADNPGVGLSMYEYHPDGSGVMYSSRRRPVLNVRPGADGWGFTPDTDLAAFCEDTLRDDAVEEDDRNRGKVAGRVDVVTDEDLHDEGVAALDGYRVLVTGSHPEYWSTAMLDGLEAWLGGGGRLMYLGGNGFYWRVAFAADRPGVMEVRRAEDGTRAWIAEPGESYHELGGEYGGLWRRLGRAPNALVGVGFAAQGFDRAAPFRRTPASYEPRVSWMFDGVEGDVFGADGVGGGAAGQEIDRYDRALGSPRHAVVVATADEHSPQMLRTKEELHATEVPGPDPDVRADVVFFEVPGGGAVFSAGSIAWYGALHGARSRAGSGDDGGGAAGRAPTDVARLTANVLRRFADPAPFVPPG